MSYAIWAADRDEHSFLQPGWSKFPSILKGPSKGLQQDEGWFCTKQTWKVLIVWKFGNGKNYLAAQGI